MESNVHEEAVVRLKFARAALWRIQKENRTPHSPEQISQLVDLMACDRLSDQFPYRNDVIDNYDLALPQLRRRGRSMRAVRPTSGNHKCTFKRTNVEQLSIKEIMLAVILLGCIVLCVYVKWPSWQEKLLQYGQTPCLVRPFSLLVEMTRPLTKCESCRGLIGPVVMGQGGLLPSREEFSQFAYSAKPVLVKGAALNWTAMSVFSFDYFKQLYSSVPGSVRSVMAECQFFPHSIEFTSLQDVFSMSAERARLDADQKPWYIGWSNCHPDISAELRKHYEVPEFLPENSEASALDWIFMGSPGYGAPLHIDFVSRPSWQAQISGKKSWFLVPPPECDAVCHSLNITVEKGDIIFVDSVNWYHETYVHPGEISITIGSEYD